MKLILFLTLLFQAVLSSAQVNLGSAATFGVLSQASITNTGPTSIDGDIGTEGTSITGFPPGIFTGSKFIASQVTIALNDATNAYDNIAELIGSTPLTGDLGGASLAPGTYSFSSSAALTGKLILAGTGSSSDAWYFQIGTSLIIATGSTVLITGGGLPCNVYWQVGTSATLGTGSSFSGNLLAGASITLDTAAVLNGGAFALGASVTMDTNVVNVQICPVISSTSSVAQGASGGPGGPGISNFVSQTISIDFAATSTSPAGAFVSGALDFVSSSAVLLGALSLMTKTPASQTILSSTPSSITSIPKSTSQTTSSQLAIDGVLSILDSSSSSIDFSSMPSSSTSSPHDDRFISNLDSPEYFTIFVDFSISFFREQHLELYVTELKLVGSRIVITV
ncbi:hypothetical protein EG329_000901 [Mollisiaceae sp. DMI_Dod_QoI]|nr:hypothetical protein EG329_000901 [Helotiales sp. DMI_Dod_QoI]